MTNGITGIINVLQKILDKTSAEGIKLGKIVEKLEHRGFGSLLMAPALIALLPTGAIPGIPTICGILIFLIAIQMLAGKKHPWIPSKLRQITISREKLTNSIQKAKPFLEKVDKWFKPRLRFLTEDAVKRVIALLCAVVGLSMIPLEVVPFAAAIPALAVVLVSIGLSTEDGVVIIIASLVFIASFYLFVTNFL